MFFSQANLFGGVDQSSSSHRIALLKFDKGEWSLQSLKEFSAQESSASINSLPKEIFFTTAVKGSEILVRPLTVKLTKENDVLDALEFQVENIFPYPNQEGVYQAQFLASKEGETQLSVVALKKDFLERHLKNTLLESECVTSIPQALAALSTLLAEAKEGEPLLMVYGDEEKFQLSISQRGVLLKSYSFSYNSSEELVRELRKALLSMATKSIDHLFVIGPMAEKALALIERMLPLSPQIPSIPSLSLSKEKLMKFGLAIGIAMMGEKASKLNFRQQEYSFPRPFKRLWRPLATLFACSFVLTILLNVGSHLLINKKKAYVEKELFSLCSSLELPQPGKALKTPMDYTVHLQALKKKVESIPTTFPLLPGIPKVKDFLGWLISESSDKGISLNSFHYTMERKPDAHRPHDRYRVRVQLELTCDSSISAKKFHEMLQGSTPYIDQSHPITWEQAKGVYRTSFLLKDKTKYYG